MQDIARCKNCNTLLIVEREDFENYKGSMLSALNNTKLCCDNTKAEWYLNTQIIYVGIRQIQTELYNKCPKGCGDC